MKSAVKIAEMAKTMSTERMGSTEIFKLLDAENIAYQVERHKPLMTVDDAKSIRPADDIGHGQIKNLFVKNKKNQMWLLTLHEDRKIDLKKTAIAIGAKRFSFCDSTRLMEYLGVIPGAVSPLALLNDTRGEVTFYVDEYLIDHPALYVHPLDNRITVEIGTHDLLMLLERHGHPHHILPQAL